jgi:hypothetical protein
MLSLPQSFDELNCKNFAGKNLKIAKALWRKSAEPFLRI